MTIAGGGGAVQPRRSKRPKRELLEPSEIREGIVVVRDGRRPDARSRMRRVIAVIDGHVCYSNGGDVNRTCQLRTFQRFAIGAEILRPSRSPR